MNFIDASRALIGFDSTPESGTLRLVEWLKTYCLEKGLAVEVYTEPLSDQQQANIIIRPSAESPPVEFMLQTHLDTADPGPYGLWEKTGHNPFDGTIIDGKIYGLGSADVKLDILCKIEALAKACEKGRQFKLPPVVVGTFGEEIGMQGSLRLIRKHLVRPKMALIGEPSDLKLIYAGKGLAEVEIRIPFSKQEKTYRIEHNLNELTSSQSRIFSGRAAHSSAPHLGDSAIRKMFDYISQLPAQVVVMSIDGGVNFNSIPAQAFLEIDPNSAIQNPMAQKLQHLHRVLKDLELRFLGYKDEQFYPPYPTLNIGRIRCDDDEVVLHGACRLPPIVTNDVYESWMKYLKQQCDVIEARFKVLDYKRPFKTETNSVFVRGCLQELGALNLSQDCVTQSSTNEASLWSRIGVECLAFGPGKRDQNIHTPTENVDIEDLRKATEFYAKVIERFCR